MPTHPTMHPNANITNEETHTYKQLHHIELKLQLFSPIGKTPDAQFPTVVFFFGGGWKTGTPDEFIPHCRYLASRGMVAATADYRVESRNGTTPFECVRDAKSAVRWLRAHAAQHGIDPDRIAAGGASAGGHIAAATDMIPGLEEFCGPTEPGEDPSVSSKPNALVLFNPVIDNGPGGYGFERVKERYREISPLHNIDADTSPTIFFLGTNDRFIPVSTAELFAKQIKATGARCDLHLYEHQLHAFFNYRIDGTTGEVNEFYTRTVREMDDFFVSLGWLGKPTGDQL